ncbi:nuclear transport factor 2 family protein [Streptomyces sp. PA03-6a]|nr:nuclear transport factor 2 family protein [Streptomyces sp. PA03-6a]
MSEHDALVEVAESLREALAAHDLPRLAALLDPAVRWGGEEDTETTCRNREDVLRWYEGLHAAGVRTHVGEVSAHQAITLATRVDWPDEDDPDEERPAELFHVFRVRNGLIYDIRGYDNRRQALDAATTHAT